MNLQSTIMVTTGVVIMDAAALLGLTEYEMRVYRGMLEEHPATAYRLGKLSGVPLSKVYEVANRLVEKGAAELVDAEPASYSPVPPLVLVNSARHLAARKLASVGAELNSHFVQGGGPVSSWVRGEDDVLGRCAALVMEAQAQVQVAAAPMAQERLQEALDRADEELAVQRHSLSAHHRGDTFFVLVVDARIAAIGHLGQDAEALVTSASAMRRLAGEFLQNRAENERLAPSQKWLDWERKKQERLLRAG